MAAFIFALTCSTIFLLVVIATAYGSGPRAACGVSLVAFLLSMCMMSQAVLLQAFLTLVVGTGCAILHCKPRTFSVGALMAAIASYGVITAGRIEPLRELDALQKEYRLESVADRLTYEATAASPDALHAAPFALAPDVESRLRESESAAQFGHRVDMLERLHSRTAADFVIAQGFGSMRMIRVSRRSIELPEGPRPELPRRKEYTPDQPPLPRPPLAAEDRMHPPSPLAMLDMHQRSAHDLVDPERSGYVQDRDHVAGFKPHQFTQLPTLGAQQRQPREWDVVKLDLISLLRHETPRAYVSNQLPRMDELRDAPTRPLDAFEARALQKLRAEEDVVIDEEPGRIRMVGSLRAGNDCLGCHNGRRGQLLGALSYELTPLGDGIEPRERQPDPPQASRTGEMHLAELRRE